MKTMRNIRIKPNPTGKDRNRAGRATAAQLGAEWVDLKNEGSAPVNLTGLSLFHVAYSNATDRGMWERVQGFTGILGAGMVMRVHSGSGPLTALDSIDLVGADSHVFTNRDSYVWNNNRGDCSALQMDGEADKFEMCWYDPNPPEGTILVRLNGKFAVPASSMATASNRH